MPDAAPDFHGPHDARFSDSGYLINWWIPGFRRHNRLISTQINAQIDAICLGSRCRSRCGADALGSQRNLKAWIFHLRPASDGDHHQPSGAAGGIGPRLASHGMAHQSPRLGGLADVPRVLPMQVTGEGGDSGDA